jgi:hypothetical protein
VVGAVEREAPQCRELGSMRFNQDEFVGVYAISTLFALVQAPTRPSRLVVQCALKLSQTIAIRLAAG